MSDIQRVMLDVYDDPSEQRSSSLEHTSSTEESQEETRLSLETSSDAIPYIGQRFVTHDAAYEFYIEFAKQRGFSIRHHRTEGKDGIGKGLVRRYFVCHHAGNTPIKAIKATKSKRNRKSSRCGCRAYMRISKNMNLGDPEWRVTGFSNHHNHELLEPNQVRFLPAYRSISDADKSRIMMFAKSGISVQQMMRLLELEKSVEPGFSLFTEKDIRNLIQSLRKVDHDEESIELLRMCKNIKEKDPNFKYDFTVDANNRLENIAWSYASSVQAYEIFGDAVVFDTTHRFTALDMSLGIWIGMNNYGTPYFFACVLLRAENSRSFSWALKVFLSFMDGKIPRTILTDQNMCLKEAIAMEMPNSKHALCIWLIAAKFPSWFNAVLGERYNEWKMEFHQLYNSDTIEDFEIGWKEMVNTFGLHANQHIANLYALRSFWALPYLRSHFLAALTMAGTSKSLNAFIQRFLSAQIRLDHFVEQVAVAVDFRDQAAKLQTMHQNLQNICLKSNEPMEANAAAVLTPYAFTKLQDELVMASHYTSFQMDGYFLVRHRTKRDGGQKVIWMPQEELLSCSCRMFEFSGFLCRHAMRVLSALDCLHIPDRYLLTRWRRINSPRRMAQSAACDQGDRVQLLQSIVSALMSEAVKSKERMDVILHEISVLLSRIRE